MKNLRQLVDAITQDLAALEPNPPLAAIAARLSDPNGPLARHIKAAEELLDRSESFIDRFLTDSASMPTNPLFLLRTPADKVWGALEDNRNEAGRPAPEPSSKF